MMNIFKNGARLAGSIVMAAVLSFFLCISINVICTALFTKDIGYMAYVYENEKSEQYIAEYEYLYTDTDGDGKDDGEDARKNEYEEQGYIINEVKIRSELKGTGKTVFLVITQILSLVMVVSFASSSVYRQGFKDSNLVRTGHVKKDIFKGLKIGIIGNIPFYVLFILLIVMGVALAPNFRTVWYAFLNGHYYSFIMWISGGVQAVSQLNITQYILLFLLQLIVPLISGIAYILGFKEINLSEKLVYKKEK